MRILMSIQTKYARKIFAGQKKWEFRKAVPRAAAESLFPVTIVVYSAGEDAAIIGEFSVGRVVSTSFNELLKVTGAGKDPDMANWLARYYSNRRNCSAVEVDRARLYERPIALSKLRTAVPSFRPPQNFVYLDNHPEVDAALRISQL